MTNEELAKQLEEQAATIKRISDELEVMRKAQEPREEFKPKRYEKIDWTANFRLPPSAAEAMAKIVPDIQRGPVTADELRSQQARLRVSGPSGMIPERRREEPQAPKPAKPAEPAEDTRSPQTILFDQMVSALVGGANDTSKLR